MQRPGPRCGLVGACAGSMMVIARADNLTACTRTHNPAGPPIRFSTFYHGVSSSATGTPDRTLSGWLRVLARRRIGGNSSAGGSEGNPTGPAARRPGRPMPV